MAAGIYSCEKLGYRFHFGVDVSVWTFRRGRFGAKVSAQTFRCGLWKKNARQVHAPFSGEFSRSSQVCFKSDYDSPKSWDDRPNSPKSGMLIFGDRATRDVLLGTQEMSFLEHRKCPACNTRDVLRGTQEMSCLEHKICPAWNTRDVLRGTHETSCLEHKRCPAWSTRDVLLGTQEL